MIEWRGQHVCVVHLRDLPQGPRGYARRREIESIWIHHSAGNFLEGEAAPRRIAAFHTAAPPRGRGWPGIGYHMVVPAFPAVLDGRFVVYRCHDDDVWAYHTGPAVNRRGFAVCVAGTYASRHVESDIARDPDPAAMLALAELVQDYLLPRFGLRAADGLFGHFDAGKPTCPGDALERWIRTTRGEEVDALGGKVPAALHFRTAAARLEALRALGYAVGDAWDEAARLAVEALQRRARLVVDGVWGPRTDAAARRLLNVT